MKILGIETSCDETAVAIVNSDREILSHNIHSQIKEHAPYGGVVPEIASRAHMSILDQMIQRTMDDAGLADFKELDAIAVTSGPGLIGGVIVGAMVAKGISAVSGVPVIPVNHLEGHALTIRLTDDTVEFPFLLLLVSGGHCQILQVNNIGDYILLGKTLDDALGEAYDKVAKMLGLGYPGGPIVEKYALEGDETRFNFPRPLLKKAGCDFSFSGLKTAVRKEVLQLDNIQQGDISDICASFQLCVGDILDDRLINAFRMYNNNNNARQLVIAGGVAANKYIRKRLDILCQKNDFIMKVAPMNLCTDNAAMIAWAGMEHMLKNGVLQNDLSFAPRARWPLAE